MVADVYSELCIIILPCIKKTFLLLFSLQNSRGIVFSIPTASLHVFSGVFENAWTLNYDSQMIVNRTILLRVFFSVCNQFSM